MQPIAIYQPQSLSPAYLLRYAWTAWPRTGCKLWQLDNESLQTLQLAWEEDGIRLLEPQWSDAMVQILFSCRPHVSPVVLAQRAKGRLQYAYRLAGHPCTFSRKTAVRSVGENTRAAVEDYIAEQVGCARFADPRFEQLLEQFTISDTLVDLADPSETRSGRYWYNLHIVLVTEDRSSFFVASEMRLVRDRSLQIAENNGYRISRVSVMPDHLHMALRGNLEHSPQDIALSFQNELAFALGQKAVWRPTYYAGTFSEYDMDAIRWRRRGD